MKQVTKSVALSGLKYRGWQRPGGCHPRLWSVAPLVLFSQDTIDSKTDKEKRLQWRRPFLQQASALPTASVGLSYSKRQPFLQQASALPTASVDLSHSKRQPFPQQASAFPTASVGSSHSKRRLILAEAFVFSMLEGYQVLLCREPRQVVVKEPATEHAARYRECQDRPALHGVALPKH